MIELLEAWSSMIPGWMMDNILQQLVLPRIQHNVEEWNPLTDTVPIHTWILPWLPFLGKYIHLNICGCSYFILLMSSFNDSLMVE